jgi:hypothetical protein
MPVTRTDVKEVLQQVKANEFHEFLKARKPARQKEIEGLRLARDRMAPDGIASRRWTITLSSADQYAELFKGPEFFSGVGDKLQIGDTIEVRDDLLTIYALLLVVVADQTRAYVEVRELFKKEVPPAVVDQEIIEGFETRYEGLSKRWCVYRKQDGHCMRTQLPSKHDAMEYIRSDLRPIKG